MHPETNGSFWIVRRRITHLHLGAEIKDTCRSTVLGRVTESSRSSAHGTGHGALGSLNLFFSINQVT
jgi:hypothetical protein